MSMLEQIKEEIIIAFKIGAKDNFDVLEQISEGFSGAEVYKIHLKSNSYHKGFFYLKIDSSPNEFNSLKNDFPFTNAKCIDRIKVGEHYALLFTLAGGSSYEFVSFYKLDRTRQCSHEAVKKNIFWYTCLQMNTSEAL